MLVGCSFKMAEMQCAIESVLKKCKINKLKSKQTEILKCLMNRQDCLAILPTAYGKSLPHQIFIPIKKALGAKQERVIVCCPLVSLMEDQVSRMSKFEDVRAALRGKDPETDSLIEDGYYDVVFASPESLVEDWVRNIQNVSLIVVDECHTVATWGGLGEDEQKAFRKCFRYIGVLRSLFSEATVLALSATCTLRMKKQISDSLNLNTATIIEVSPNRDNIKYIVTRIPTEIEQAFFWLVEGLSELKNNFPRTLIYCNSIQDAGKIYHYLTTELNHNDFVEMYHSETPLEKKNYIVEQLRMKSDLKVIIATSALGMGIDVQDCNGIILYGPPADVVDLLQETGRCGRDGTMSVAVIFCNRYQLSHVSEEVKDIIRCTDCRRKHIMKNFTTEEHLMKTPHFCCDLCATKCACGSCVNLPLENLTRNISVKEIGEDSVSSDSDTISYEYESDPEKV